jgi:hypothetical protein
MHRTTTRFNLIVTIALFAAAKIAAQQALSATEPQLQRSGGGEAAAAKRVVDGIMQPYLAEGQRTSGSRRWSRSPNPRAIVAVSLHGRPVLLPVWKSY